MIKLNTIEQVEFNPALHVAIKDFFEKKLSLKNNQDDIDQRQAGRGNLSGTKESEKKIWSFFLTDPGYQVFLTRMKQLPYQSFSAVKSNERVFIKAITKPLMINMPSTNRRNGMPGKYDIGSYSIYLDVHSLLTGTTDHLHFIPDRNPIAQEGRATHYRHMHHYATLSESNGGKRSNPLTYYASTCWGSFGPIVISNLYSGDIVELFRVLHMFIVVHNPSSPLLSVPDLPHYRRINA